MPRTARRQVPGGIFHLVSRFVRGAPLLDLPEARARYLALIDAATRSTDTEVLAYCLMSTHVHLVVRQGDVRLERFTKSVHTGLASFLRANPRTTHRAVFSGRPWQLLVEAERYLLPLVRYVHNHPVRAGLVGHARQSDWSSHRAYLGLSPAPAWLRPEPVLAHLDADPATAKREFDAYVDAGAHETRRPEFGGARNAGEAAAVRTRLGAGDRLSAGVLGTAAFVQGALASGHPAQARFRHPGASAGGPPLGRPAVRDVIDAAAEVLQVDPLELSQRPRTRAAAQVKRLSAFVWVQGYGGPQVELARALQLNTSAVSRYCGQALAAADDLGALARTVRAVLKQRRGPGPLRHR